MAKEVSRRDFLKRTAAASAVGAVVLGESKLKVFAAVDASKKKGTVIDLTKCDGCKSKGTPECVMACRLENEKKFPEVQEEFLKPYWPQKSFEDHSGQKDEINRLTPFNWTFVDQVTVEHEGKAEEVFVPRRCMHCENPSCKGLCPFGAIDKSESGAVCINDELCFGGAKCRDVCPWGIPQRQAGVGIYTKIAPDIIGGGVMYKCDMCHDRLEKGLKPACVEACPNQAITFGSFEETKAYAKKRAKEIGGYVYGENENGGTLTLYVSKVPFEKIDEAIGKSKKESNDQKPGRPLMPVDAPNKLDSVSGMGMAALIAPVAGIVTAGYMAAKTMKGGNKNEE